MICNDIIRPCINYSVSLEAVVWDGEHEEAFQYEPVKDDYEDDDDDDDDYRHILGMRMTRRNYPIS